MKHNYSLQNSKLKPFKLIILAAALVFDFANIWVFISGIVERNVPRILQALGVFLALLLVRVGSTFLTCRHDYNFDQTKLVVSKVFPYLRPNLSSSNMTKSTILDCLSKTTSPKRQFGFAQSLATLTFI